GAARLPAQRDGVDLFDRRGAPGKDLPGPQRRFFVEAEGVHANTVPAELVRLVPGQGVTLDLETRSLILFVGVAGRGLPHLDKDIVQRQCPLAGVDVLECAARTDEQLAVAALELKVQFPITVTEYTTRDDALGEFFFAGFCVDGAEKGQAVVRRPDDPEQFALGPDGLLRQPHLFNTGERAIRPDVRQVDNAVKIQSDRAGELVELLSLVFLVARIDIVAVGLAHLRASLRRQGREELGARQRFEFRRLIVEGPLAGDVPHIVPYFGVDDALANGERAFLLRHRIDIKLGLRVVDLVDGVDLILVFLFLHFDRIADAEPEDEPGDEPQRHEDAQSDPEAMLDKRFFIELDVGTHGFTPWGRLEAHGKLRTLAHSCRAGRVFETHHAVQVGLEDSIHPTDNITACRRHRPSR